MSPGPHREVEDHRGRDDRDRAALHLHAAAALLQPSHDAVGGGQAEGAPAGEYDGVDVTDAGRHREQLGLPTARGTAANIHRADGAGWGEYDGRPAGPPGARRRVVGRREIPHGRVRIAAVVMTDSNAGDVSDGTESGAHRMVLPIRPSTRYSCSTVSHP